MPERSLARWTVAAGTLLLAATVGSVLLGSVVLGPCVVLALSLVSMSGRPQASAPTAITTVTRDKVRPLLRARLTATV